MAAPEGEREARKRRERRDSGCTHERKERRPHSEERAPPPPPPSRLQDYNRLESERRAERLSRARRPQFGGKRRRAPTRQPRPYRENDFATNNNNENIPTPCATPPRFEYVVEQPPEEPEVVPPVCEEVDREVVADRHVVAMHARRDERSVPPRRTQTSPDRRLETIRRKISMLKKNIAKYESDYEQENGHPITLCDRITNVQLTRMDEALRVLQEEKRCIKADPVEYAIKTQASKLQKQRDDKLDGALRSHKPLSSIVKDIEEWVDGCRRASGRADVPESNWTAAQFAEEKECVQRALLRLEAARGRPPLYSIDRGAARPLYDRYRDVKRAIAMHRQDNVLGTNGELATIHEHEMLFNTSVDSSSDSQEKPSSSQETVETTVQSPPTRDVNEDLPSSSSSTEAPREEAAPSNEGLHYMGLEDLARAMAEAKLLKCTLRRAIKEYEATFEMQHCRKAQRDDKKGHEDEYIRYKEVKSRIKLLNALINKQKSLNRPRE